MHIYHFNYETKRRVFFQITVRGAPSDVEKSVGSRAVLISSDARKSCGAVDRHRRHCRKPKARLCRRPPKASPWFRNIHAFTAAIESMAISHEKSVPPPRPLLPPKIKPARSRATGSDAKNVDSSLSSPATPSQRGKHAVRQKRGRGNAAPELSELVSMTSRAVSRYRCGQFQVPPCVRACVSACGGSCDELCIISHICSLTHGFTHVEDQLLSSWLRKHIEA